MIAGGKNSGFCAGSVNFFLKLFECDSSFYLSLRVANKGLVLKLRRLSVRRKEEKY